MVFFLKGRRARVELENYLSRVAEVTHPDGASDEENQRSESRISRIFPVLIAPWEDNGPVIGQFTYGLSRDISSHGMSIVLTRPFRKINCEVVVGMWPTNELLTAVSTPPGFILGEVRQEVEMGAAFYRLGVMFKELVDEQHPSHEKLYAQAKCLLPPEQLRQLKAARF
jgi:hypothetical protein